jgi:hypothetical protein
MRDVNGAIVRKASEVRSIALATTPVRLSPAVLFVREPTLPAGQYMLEAAVHDLNSDRLAAKYLPLTVPAVVSNGIALGDLLLVQRIGLRNGDETRHESVLDAQDGIIVPRLDRTFVMGVDQAVAFFTRARWFDQRQTVVAKVSLLEGLTTIGEGVLAPKLTNTPGVAEVAGTIPLAGHGPGTYTLRVTLEDDGAAVRKETEIRIVERPSQP